MDSEDDGNGNPFLWCIVYEEGTWSGTSRDAVLEFLLKLAERVKERGRKLQVWATNLEYDLVNVFDTERIREVTLRFGRSALCGAQWRGIEFRDTVRHLPISVAAFGELVGLEKLEGGLFERTPTQRTMERFKRRCMRDAAITFRAARFLHKAYAELRVRARMTLASTALNLWKDEFWGANVFRPDAEVLAAAFSAYHGGRTQAFAAGTFEKVKAIDAASMFPWAMCSSDLPLPWGLYRRVPAGAAITGLGLYRARVRSRIDFPVLPVRTEAGTIYPNGTWTGWYVGEELESFVRHGGTLRVLEGFEFAERVRPFDAYVTKLFALKSRARGAKRLLYKLLLNGLYGKFGQQGRRVHAVPIEKILAMDDPPLDWRPWNGLGIFSTDHTPPPWSNHLWPAIITARARIRLADQIARIVKSGGRPLYCDTDSVMFTGGRVRYPSAARNVGDFELRGTYRSALIVGKKEYALELRKGKWLTHAKGVPEQERERYLREGRADFERPMKIRESARRGLQANVWKAQTKQRRTFLRGRTSDGALPVPSVHE